MGIATHYLSGLRRATFRMNTGTTGWRSGTMSEKDTKSTMKRFSKALSAGVAAAAMAIVPVKAQDLVESLTEAAGVPQIPAFLPDKYSVEENAALPIDGVWSISTIRKKIRIEKGRAYALDPWLHMFVLKVQPDMVVLQNFQRTSAGVFTADDLPLVGPATFRLRPDGNMDVTVQGVLGPVSYKLIKRETDDSYAFDSELAAMSGRGDADDAYPVAPHPPAPDIGADNDPLADCENLGVDPITDDVVCLD